MRTYPRNSVADNSVPYDDAVAAPASGHECSPETSARALDAAEAVLALAAAGKLDRTDLQIIEERTHSPMPTMRELGAIVGIDVAAVHRRVNKIRSMLMRSARRFSRPKVNKHRL